MPTYEYACSECAARLEVVQRFTDEALTVCPTCGGRLRKVFSPVGVVFKGSGFYRTDSRPAKTSETAAKSDSKPAESKPSESKPASGSDSKPSKSGASDKVA